jgi:hypothetical protein
VLPPQCRTTLICREVNAHMRSRSNLKYFQFGKRCWYKFKHANFYSKTVAHLQISSSSKEFKCYIVIFSTLKLLLDSENVSQFSFPLLRNDMLLIFNWSFSIKYGRSVWIHRLPSNTQERKISLI